MHNLVQLKNHLLHDGTNDRPADILLPNWYLNKSLCIDVSVVDSLKGYYNDSYDPSSSLSDAAALKNLKYLDRCNKEGLLFLPFIVGSFGGFCKDAEDILKSLGKALANVKSSKIVDEIKYLKQWISVSVQINQSNAVLLKGRARNILLF